jgi:hypothetical protein
VVRGLLSQQPAATTTVGAIAIDQILLRHGKKTAAKHIGRCLVSGVFGVWHNLAAKLNRQVLFYGKTGGVLLLSIFLNSPLSCLNGGCL